MGIKVYEKTLLKFSNFCHLFSGTSRKVHSLCKPSFIRPDHIVRELFHYLHDRISSWVKRNSRTNKISISDMQNNLLN